MKINNLTRCDWVGDDPLNIKYHDQDWGVPVYDDRLLFEMLTLEGAQAGLSWLIILRKRDAYKIAFDNFDVLKIAKYDSKKVFQLLNNSGIVRNKLKINSVIINAKNIIKLNEEFGSFDKYIWSLVKYKSVKNNFKNLSDIPAKNDISEKMSADLLRRGFKFVGPTICYAFMQAVGLVNDHQVKCFRYNKLS